MLAPMKAMTVIPGRPDSARVDELPEPDLGDGAVLVDGLLVGICGTDGEITQQGYGVPPAGSDRLVLCHESLGRVVEAPAGGDLEAGDLIAGIVRRPDPVPCEPCGNGQWDFCRNGQYTERGIKGRNGYGAQRWRVEPEYAVRLDQSLGDLAVLLEPTSVVAKAWAQVKHVSGHMAYHPKVALVTGAGPIGLLAAMLGRQYGYEVHVLDRITDGPKPGIVADLGATYHSSPPWDSVTPDVVIECTGVGALLMDVLQHTAVDAVTCLTGIHSGGRPLTFDADALNKELVLDNDIVVGSVNAGRPDYAEAAAALARADKDWLARLVTRRVPLERWPEALTKTDADVKVVVDLTQG